MEEKEKGLRLQEEVREQRTTGLARKETDGRGRRQVGFSSFLKHPLCKAWPIVWQQDETSEPISRMRIRASKGQSHQTSKCSVDAGGCGGVPEGF